MLSDIINIQRSIQFKISLFLDTSFLFMMLLEYLLQMTMASNTSSLSLVLLLLKIQFIVEKVRSHSALVAGIDDNVVLIFSNSGDLNPWTSKTFNCSHISCMFFGFLKIVSLFYYFFTLSYLDFASWTGVKLFSWLAAFINMVEYFYKNFLASNISSLSNVEFCK